MYAAKGVGLAAPQIGVGKRIAVIDTTVGEDTGQKLVLINPEIIGKEGSQSGEEGCLSLPTFRETVTRAKKVTVRAFDATGKPFEMTGEDLLARAFLHETDHLNGMLYISHISPLKRDLSGEKSGSCKRRTSGDRKTGTASFCPPCRDSMKASQ